MTEYEVYQKDVLIGILQIENGLYRYLPVFEAVQALQDKVPLTSEMIRGYPWGKPIPFFKERIENAARFGEKACIRYHTDAFVIRLVTE